MINELVNSILQAEAKADEILREANERAAQITASADKRDGEFRAKAEEALREESLSAVQKNENEACALYQRVIKQGEADAERIKSEAKERVDALSDEVVRCILSGNC